MLNLHMYLLVNEMLWKDEILKEMIFYLNTCIYANVHVIAHTHTHTLKSYCYL